MACPGNFQLSAQGLRIVGNLAIHSNRIYFVALYGNNPALTDSFRIHCLVDNGVGWVTVSPTYSAVFAGQPLASQVKAASNGEICVSPDGKTIAYLAAAPIPFVFYYKFIGGSSYEFKAVNGFTSFNRGDNSLQFRGNTEIFYATRWYHNFVHNLKFEELFCENEIFEIMP